MSHNSDIDKKQDENIVVFPERKTIHDEAAEWLSRLDADKPNGKTLADFSLWVNADPAHAQEYRRLAEQWDELNLLTQMTLPSEQVIETFETTNNKHWGWPAWLASSSFAAVFLAVVVAFFGLDDSQQVLYVTAIGEQKTITLADNSVVQLNTNSRLSVDYNDKRRGIYLIEGEAHFQVAHNPDLPFEVYTGTGVVRAVGTSFSVYIKHKQVEVVVDQGVVEIDKMPAPALLNKTEAAQTALPVSSGVSSGMESSSIESNDTKAILKSKPTRIYAGAKATFEHHKPLQLSLEENVEIDTQLAWRTGALKFRQETLQHLVDEISRYTATKIIITDSAARDMRVGGLFEIGNTQAMFDALELGFGIKVDRIDEHLVYLSIQE